MIERFGWIRLSLITVADTESASCILNRSIEFQEAQKYDDQLNFINECTLRIQKSEAKRSECLSLLDTPIYAVRKYNSGIHSVLFECKLKEQYIREAPKIAKHPHVESEVIRIQRN